MSKDNETLDKIEEEAFCAMAKTFTQWSIANAEKNEVHPSDTMVAVSRASIRFGFLILSELHEVDRDKCNELLRVALNDLGNLIKEKEDDN